MVRGRGGDQQAEAAEGQGAEQRRPAARQRAASRASARRSAKRAKSSSAPDLGDEEDQPRQRAARQQVLAARAWARHEALEQLAVARDHQREADAPHARAHEVHAEQARHQEVDVARAGLGHARVRPASKASCAAGRALQRGVDRQARGAALGLRAGRRSRPAGRRPSTTSDDPAAGAAPRAPRRAGEHARLQARRRARASGRAALSARGPATTADRQRVRRPAAEREAEDAPPAGSGTRRPRTPPPARATSSRTRASVSSASGPRTGSVRHSAIAQPAVPVRAMKTSSSVAWCVVSCGGSAPRSASAASSAGTGAVHLAHGEPPARRPRARTPSHARAARAAPRRRAAARSLDRELDDVLGAERGDQLARRAERDDLAVIHDRDAVAQPRRLLHVVRGEQHRAARAP